MTTPSQVQTVTNFQDLVSTTFRGTNNALCWTRELQGDFAEIVKKINLEENIKTLAPAELLELQLSDAGQLARDILLNDLKLLKAQGADPIINIIKSYDRDDSYPPFPKDVYSWHVDRSPVPFDTYLCTYHGASSDLLPNAEATQKILIPQIRAELLKLYGQEEDEEFETFLSDNFFDLHYQAKPNATPINLGHGHLWRLAIDHPEREVLPCIHRAPLEPEGERRLMLIC